MKEDLTKEIALPEGVSAFLKGAALLVKGPQGEAQRTFLHPKVRLRVAEKQITLVAEKATKREKKIVNSFAVHIRNMVQGVQEMHLYKLKICSGHFPMNVAVAGGELVIKNFLGENTPRKVSILPGVEVKVAGNDIEVRSPDKERAGQMAARIELLCRITNRDLRIFQDGCFIYEKAGRGVA